MIKTIVGLVLLLIPFLAVVRFKDRKLSIFYIFSFLLAFHLALAVIAQALGIFTYPVILGANALLCLGVLLTTNFSKVKERLKQVRIDWVLIFIIIIISISLFAVHYNFTGKITLATDPNYRQVEHMTYPYPYFSDEWYAISLIKYSISSHSLPLVNPLYSHLPFFPNFELPFHSFTAEIIVLLDLNPLTQYTLLTIFTGLIICLLVYFFLKSNKVRNLTAGISALAVLYLVNGANLPGVWYLIPLTMGMIAMLLGFIFISQNKIKMALFTAILVLLFYPPLFVLYTFAFFVYLLTTKELNKKAKTSSASIYLVICVAVTLFLAIFAFLSPNNALQLILGKIYYETFTPDAIPDFSILKVVPWPILIFGVLGVFYLFKKKIYWLLAPLIVGLVYWGIYTFSLYRFVIEYERVVVATSIIVALIAGFGLHYLIILLNKNKIIREYNIMTWIRAIVFIVLFVLAFSYTNNDRWMELKLFNQELKTEFMPAAPANNYLTDGDLSLFSDIKGKKFLSIPWKGTVLAVATDNYPTSAKPGTLGAGKQNTYYEFINADCTSKLELVQKKQINYVYSLPFNCTGFEFIDKTEEQLYLYRVLE